MLILMIILALAAIGCLVGLIVGYRKGMRSTIAILLAIVMVLSTGGAIWSGIAYSHQDPGKVDTGVPDVDRQVKLGEIVIDDLFGDYSRYFLRSSLPNMANPRTNYAGFSDAVSIPLSMEQDWFDRGTKWERIDPDADPDSVKVDADDRTIAEKLEDNKSAIKEMSEEERFDYYRAQIYNEILRNPIYGDMVARFFLEDELIAKHNGVWLQEFVDKMDAAYATDGKDPAKDPIGAEYWLMYEEGYAGDRAHIMTTDEYYQYAARLCLVLEYFADDTVAAEPSIENYCLPFAEYPRTEKADYQEEETAYILVYKNKAGDILDRFGFNILDRRVERFQEETPPEEPDSTTPPPKETTPPPKETTPPPEETTPPPETSKPPKDPADDPVHQGNADKGGGDNKPGDGTGDHQNYQDEVDDNKDYVPPVTTTPPDDHSNDTVTDPNGGHTDNGAPPSTEKPDQGSNVTGTETTDNGDGTTTTGKVDISDEDNDSHIEIPD